MTKRLVSRDPPDTGVLREAMTAANAHLDYIDYLLDHRRWLAGPVLTLADLAAAAHLSVADYLGGIDWRGHKQTVDWYAVMKSRPSFRAAAHRADGGDRAAAPITTSWISDGCGHSADDGLIATPLPQHGPHPSHADPDRNHAQSGDPEIPARPAGDGGGHARFRDARGGRGLAARRGDLLDRRGRRRVLRPRLHLGHRRAGRRLARAEAAGARGPARPFRQRRAAVPARQRGRHRRSRRDEDYRRRSRPTPRSSPRSAS